MKSYKTKNMNLQLFAGEITDLTGTTWEFIDNPNFATFPTNISFNFISDNTSFTNMYPYNTSVGDSEPNYFCIYFDMNTNTNITPYNSNSWTNQIYRTISITGGTDATNQDLISWLQANATQAQTGYSSTIILTNCTCNKSSETGLSGSYIATVTSDNGYYLSSVTSTLGTVEIATNKKTATVTISNVTEDFTITATGTEIEKIDIILHPNNNGETDYTKEILPKIRTATTLEINRLFRTEYTITKNITNGSSSGDTTIWSEETAQITITPDADYSLPNIITVTNASYTYDSTTGVVGLSNAIGNVSINAICESSAWGGTDLTGTSWELNDNLSISPLVSGSEFMINFTSNNNSYVDFYIDSDKMLVLSYGNLMVYTDGWQSSDYKTISIIGGTDATNSTLINWLQDNATLISW